MQLKITDGVLNIAEQRPSPNYDVRPNNAVDLLVIHNISLPAAQFGEVYVEHLFQNQLDCSAHSSFESLEGVCVSAHLFIRRDGAVIQFVNFNERAWHAGVSSFDGINNCNDFSLGIELEGTDDISYSTAQYKVLAAVTGAIRKAYPAITLDRIAGHCDIAPTRKSDPGPAFDWDRYKQLLELET